MAGHRNQWQMPLPLLPGHNRLWKLAAGRLAPPLEPWQQQLPRQFAPAVSFPEFNLHSCIYRDFALQLKAFLGSELLREKIGVHMQIKDFPHIQAPLLLLLALHRRVYIVNRLSAGLYVLEIYNLSHSPPLRVDLI